MFPTFQNFVFIRRKCSQERLLLPCSLLYQIWIPFHNLGFFQSPLMGRGWCAYLRKQHLFVVVLTRCCSVAPAAHVVRGLWPQPWEFSHIRVLWIPFGVFLSSAAAAVGVWTVSVYITCPPPFANWWKLAAGLGFKKGREKWETVIEVRVTKKQGTVHVVSNHNRPLIIRETEGTCPKQSVSSCPLPSSLKSALLLTGRCAQCRRSHPPTLWHNRTDTCTAAVSTLHVLSCKSRG